MSLSPNALSCEFRYKTRLIKVEVIKRHDLDEIIDKVLCCKKLRKFINYQIEPPGKKEYKFMYISYVGMGKTFRDKIFLKFHSSKRYRFSNIRMFYMKIAISFEV